MVVGHGAPFTRNALFIIQYHHHHYYGCEHGGLGWTLPFARVNHGTLQCPLVQVRMLAPHHRPRDSSGLTDPPPFGAHRVRQYGHSVIHQQAERSGLPRPSTMRSALYMSGRSPGHWVSGLTRHQERVGRLPIAKSPRPHRVAPPPTGSSASVPGVRQAPDGPVRLPPEPPAPLLVLSDRSPYGGGLQPPVLVLNRAVPLRLSLIPLLEKTLIRWTRSLSSPPVGLGLGTTFSFRWRARSHSGSHTDMISCHNAYPIRACSTIPTWKLTS